MIVSQTELELVCRLHLSLASIDNAILRPCRTPRKARLRAFWTSV
jgi:hypothetical protein